MPEKLVIHCLVGCPLTLRIVMTAFALGLNPTIKWYYHKWQLNTDEYKNNNHELASGLVETEHGSLTDSAAIMRYFAGFDNKQNLYGTTCFEKAQIDMLLAEAHKVYISLKKGFFLIKGAQPGTEKDVKDIYNKLPVQMKSFEDRLGKGTYLLGENMTIADICLASYLVINRGCALPTGIIFMKRLPNMSRWFDVMTSQSFWKKLFGNSFSNAKTMNVPDSKDVEAYLADPENSPTKIARFKQGISIPSSRKQSEVTIEVKQVQPEQPI